MQSVCSRPSGLHHGRKCLETRRSHPTLARSSLLEVAHRPCRAARRSSAAAGSRSVRMRVAEAPRELQTEVATTTPVSFKDTTIPAYRSSGSMDYEGLYDTTPSCPLGGVEEIMRKASSGVLTCLPHETLEGVIPKLSKVTGLPVLNDSGRVVGVLSRKDIIRVRKTQGNLQDQVKDHMTTPAITIKNTASVQEAANLMLSKKIRRLPVVDESGYPVGIVSRSDIFKPLFMEQYTAFMDKEVAALQGQVKKGKQITWAVKYLYDGDCAMCQSLKNVLERQDKGKGRIKFVNIADPNYNPSKHMGIEYEEAMETIHAIKPDGKVLYGTDALRAMFSEVGLGWAANLSESPLLAKLVDVVYEFLSKNRLSLGGALDGIIVAKRMELSKKGVETCGDMDEECTVEW